MAKIIEKYDNDNKLIKTIEINEDGELIKEYSNGKVIKTYSMRNGVRHGKYEDSEKTIYYHFGVPDPSVQWNYVTKDRKYHINKNQLVGQILIDNKEYYCDLEDTYSMRNGEKFFFENGTIRIVDNRPDRTVTTSITPDLNRVDVYKNYKLVETYFASPKGYKHGLSQWFSNDRHILKSIEYEVGQVKRSGKSDDINEGNRFVFTWIQEYEGRYFHFDVVDNEVKRYVVDDEKNIVELKNNEDNNYKFIVQEDHIQIIPNDPNRTVTRNVTSDIISVETFKDNKLVEVKFTRQDGTLHGDRSWYSDDEVIKSIEYSNGKVKDGWNWFQKFPNDQYIYFNMRDGKIVNYAIKKELDSFIFEGSYPVFPDLDNTFIAKDYKFILDKDNIKILSLVVFNKVQEHDNEYFHFQIIDNEIKRYVKSDKSNYYIIFNIKGLKKAHNWFYDKEYRFKIQDDHVLIKKIQPSDLILEKDDCTECRFLPEYFRVNKKGVLDGEYFFTKDNGYIIRKIIFENGKLSSGYKPNWFENYNGQWYHFHVKDNQILDFCIKNSNDVSTLDTYVPVHIDDKRTFTSDYEFTLDLDKMMINIRHRNNNINNHLQSLTSCIDSKINDSKRTPDYDHVLTQKTQYGKIEYHGIKGQVKMIKYYNGNEVFKTSYIE